MTEPFTLRIFVPTGNPEEIIVIDRLNWTGLGIKFVRIHWDHLNKQRKEFLHPGIYILIEDQENDDLSFVDNKSDLPKLYIGQAENLHNRINQHNKKKDFWDWGIAFISSSNRLNKGHLAWLEYSLIQKVHENKRCVVENSVIPTEPNLSESDKADTDAFLKEILQILPLMNLHVFSKGQRITPNAITTQKGSDTLMPNVIDTIVVPAHKEGFQKVFLEENCWWAVRIASSILEKLKYIAAYQVSPISAITHIASIKHIEPYGNGRKYKIVFSEKAKAITPIPFGQSKPGTMQSHRYTSFSKIKNAKTIADL